MMSGFRTNGGAFGTGRQGQCEQWHVVRGVLESIGWHPLLMQMEAFPLGPTAHRRMLRQQASSWSTPNELPAWNADQHREAAGIVMPLTPCLLLWRATERRVCEFGTQNISAMAPGCWRSRVRNLPAGSRARFSGMTGCARQVGRASQPDRDEPLKLGGSGHSAEGGCPLCWTSYEGSRSILQYRIVLVVASEVRKPSLLSV